jgi:hypothetical protein
MDDLPRGVRVQRPIRHVREDVFIQVHIGLIFVGVPRRTLDEHDITPGGVGEFQDLERTRVRPV